MSFQFVSNAPAAVPVVPVLVNDQIRGQDSNKRDYQPLLDSSTDGTHCHNMTSAKPAVFLRTDYVKIDTANAASPVFFRKVGQLERQTVQQPAAGQAQPSKSQPKVAVKQLQVTRANRIPVTARIVVAKRENGIKFFSTNPACKRSLPLPSDESVEDKKQKIKRWLATSSSMEVITTESAPNSLEGFTTISQKPVILQQPLTSELTATATLQSSVPDTIILSSAVSTTPAREPEQQSERVRKFEELDSEELLRQYEPDEEVTDDESISSAVYGKLDKIYQFDHDARPLVLASIGRGEGNCPPITQRKSSTTGRRGNERSGGSNFVSKDTPSITLRKFAEANKGLSSVASSSSSSSSSITQLMKMKEREKKTIWRQKIIAVLERLAKVTNRLAEKLESRH